VFIIRVRVSVRFLEIFSVFSLFPFFANPVPGLYRGARQAAIRFTPAGHFSHTFSADQTCDMKITVIIQSIFLALVVDAYVSGAFARHREGKYKGTHWW